MKLTIVPCGSNGQGKFVIDLPRLRKYGPLLPASVAVKFGQLLKETAAAVRKQGDEYRAIAQDQYDIAGQLESLWR